MKGPAGRVNLDVRRLWKCPECGTLMRFLGNTTQKLCKCNKDGVWMNMIEEPQQKRVMGSIQKMIDQPDINPNIILVDETDS